MSKLRFHILALIALTILTIVTWVTWPPKKEELQVNKLFPKEKITNQSTMVGDAIVCEKPCPPAKK